MLGNLKTDVKIQCKWEDGKCVCKTIGKEEDTNTLKILHVKITRKMLD